MQTIAAMMLKVCHLELSKPGRGLQLCTESEFEHHLTSWASVSKTVKWTGNHVFICSKYPINNKSLSHCFSHVKNLDFHFKNYNLKALLHSGSVSMERYVHMWVQVHTESRGPSFPWAGVADTVKHLTRCWELNSGIWTFWQNSLNHHCCTVLHLPRWAFGGQRTFGSSGTWTHVISLA